METFLTWVLLLGGTAAFAMGFQDQSPVVASIGYVCIVIGAFALGDNAKQADLGQPQ
jgi:hypothetical protein